MSVLSLLEFEVCHVWSQIVGVKLLRETHFVKQIALICNLLQGADRKGHVECSTMQNISRQICRVKERLIEE